MSAMMVPEGWEVKTVSQTCDILDNKRIPLNDEERQSMKGHIPYYGANAIVDYIDSYLFDEDLILLAEDGGNFDDYENRQIAYKITGKSWVNNHAHIVRPRKKFDFDFIFYSLQHKNITSFIRGGTRSKLNQSDLKAVELLTPISYSEQQKIASILSTLDRTIEATQKLIDKEKMVKKGLMADLLTHGIDEQGRIRSPQTHRYVDSPLGMIPEGWEAVEIQKMVKITTGNRDTQDSIEHGLYPFYVRSQTIERINSYSFDGEAILTAGDGVGVGKVFHHVNEKFDFHQRVYCLSHFDKDVDPKFLFEYFRINFIKQVNKYSAKGSVDSVRFDMIAKMLMPLPPKSEQQKIAQILSGQDRKIETEETNLAKLQNLKKGLMGDLLSGKVRVKING